MNRRETVTLGPIRIPPRLKGRLVREIERRQSNMNDLVSTILAAHYEIDYTPTGVALTNREITAFDRIRLDVPPEVKDAVVADADARRESQRNVVVEILSDRLGIKFEPTGRWPKTAA